MGKKYTSISIILILLFLILSGCTEPKTSWGDAPDFTLKTLDGETIKLSDFQGKVILLDFFGVNCPYCHAQMPILKQISENYTDVVIISVDVYPYETEEYLQSYINYLYEQYDLSLDWYFGMDPDGSIAQTYVKNSGVPRLVIIDKNGNIKYERSGLHPYSNLAAELEKYI